MSYMNVHVARDKWAPPTRYIMLPIHEHLHVLPLPVIFFCMMVYVWVCHDVFFCEVKDVKQKKLERDMDGCGE